MNSDELLSKKLMLRGNAFAPIRASAASDANNFLFTLRGLPLTAIGNGGGPVQPYQDTPVIVCVISG